MPQTILGALQGLAALQSALTIAAPVATGIKEVFYLPPDWNQPVEYPCWFNTWAFTEQIRVATEVLQHRYAIHNEFWVHDPDTDRAAEIATAFMDVYIAALNQNITLSSAVSTSELRGGDPTLVRSFDSNGVLYAGLDLYLDVTLTRQIGFA